MELIFSVCKEHLDPGVAEPITARNCELPLRGSSLRAAKT
jgi:hypothetical protein